MEGHIWRVGVEHCRAVEHSLTASGDVPHLEVPSHTTYHLLDCDLKLEEKNSFLIVRLASLTWAPDCEEEHARIVTCGVERPCRAIAVDRDVVSVVGGQSVNRAPASSPASHRVGRDSHGAVVDPHLDVSSLLLEQSLWCWLLRLGDLAKLIVVAIVEVAVALVAWVEALLGVGSGVGGQLGVVQGGRLPVCPLLLLLLVGVVDPGLVGHRDSSLVLRSRQVFIPARGFGGLVERIKRRKRHYEAHSRQPLKTDK